MTDTQKRIPLISVIIPVYQAEQYLDACIGSVLAQDYPAVEIILVDDGSSDKSAGICDRYGGAYKNIRVIHQRNRGTGAAKNRGMELAKGEYLLFLDADDCLDGKTAVTYLLEKAEAEQADIVTGNYRRFRGKWMGGVYRHHLKSDDAGKTDFRFKGFLSEGHLLMNWAKIYRSSFLRHHRITFSDYPVMEDKLFNMICCASLPVYGFVEENVYLYRITEGSLTDRYKENAGYLAEVWLSVGTYFEGFLREQHSRNLYEDLLAFHLFCGIFTLGRESLQSGRGAVKKAVGLLKLYGKNPMVKRYVSALAKGNYIREVQPAFWRLLVRAASMIFCLGGYRLIIAGIWVFRRIGNEERGRMPERV